MSEEWSRLIHRIGREREDKIISGKTKLKVATILLIDDNWRVFKEYREIIGKPLRQEEEIEEADGLLDLPYKFFTLSKRRGNHAEDGFDIILHNVLHVPRRV